MNKLFRTVYHSLIPGGNINHPPDVSKQVPEARISPDLLYDTALSYCERRLVKRPGVGG